MIISKLNSTDLGLCLDAAGVVGITADEPLQIEPLRGALWVTISGDSADYWLAPGDRLQVAAGGQVVVEAMQPSRVRFLALQRLPASVPAAVAA